MARLVLLICLICVLLALVGAAISALTRAAQDGRALARDIAAPGKGILMERISYTALILLMLGVTSGLLGGL
ncbi:hypothetical protein [Roseovarius dicentrarchi]|uniref:hypothetical protein n=1 Tax=Roseovarius dicentrarchi TaxID=2250573 RepID=UPI000DE9E5B2|nr:hypothetical protein [Roseovarius dicentrarchi]